MNCSAQELLAIARKGRPNVRYALHRNGNWIGAYSETDQRFVIVAGRTIMDGEWCSLPVELLIDGKPVHEAGDWIE